MHNSHTRKFLNRAIISRRQTVHTLMAKGYSQYEAAAILQCSQETICKDVAWLREYYKQQIHRYNHLKKEVMYSYMISQDIGRNMLVAELFLKSLVKLYGKHIVYSDDAGSWYPQACCNSLRLKHILHSPFEKRIVERAIVEYVKDRTEDFDDNYPLV